MQTVETLLVAVALGCDAFAVGMGVGARYCNARQVFRLSFHFGLFQFLMPLAGWYAGSKAVDFGMQWAPWIAFGLLFFIGARMSYTSIRSREDDVQERCDPTRGFSLIVLSVATSMDALGVGFSLGVMGSGLLFSALVIGVTASVMTLSAMKLGNRLSKQFGRFMEVAGGIILMGIAVKLLMM